jgi:glutamate 5-kinase
MSPAQALAHAKRIVVKIGSATLVDGETGAIKHEWLATLIADVARLRAEKKEVLLVSSGAVALGRRVLKLKGRTLRLEESQASAAVGQVHLAQTYVDALQVHGLVAAQILLTLDDSENRRRYLNARATLKTLLDLGAIPVINENDTVATAEIRFGDNDRLAARVATMIEADCVVLLSDIDGLYSANPQRDATAEHIPHVRAITPRIEAMAEGTISGLGRGGMESKITAAKIATAAGAHVLISSGGTNHPLQAIEDGARATLFSAHGNPTQARKRWIAGGLNAQGKIAVDAGAVAALKSGKSLLPAGVTRVEGHFERGDTVQICGPDGYEIARGLIAYPAEEAVKIAGARSGDIEALLGYRGRDAIIHRDDLALTAGHEEEP